ncbi:hypothetical protein ACEPAF_8930 [Sanghuangporus sanghuang]
MKSVSPTDQAHIIDLLTAGQTTCQIASATGFNQSTISRMHSKYCSELEKALGAKTAVQVAHALHTITNDTLSTQTVRNHLRKAGMKAVAKKKKLKLTCKQKRDHYDFVIAHCYWTLEDWKKVVWSDETNINRIGSDSRQWIWKFAGQGLISKEVKELLKFGGGHVMVWGCMLWQGTGIACKIDRNMDKELYTQILEDELQGSLEHHGISINNIIFQHDNNPKHTSKMATSWLKDHGFEVLLWPAQSPDLDPLNTSGIMRMEAVIKAKGAHTKY